MSCCACASAAGVSSAPRPRSWRTPPIHRGVALATALRSMLREVRGRNCDAAGVNLTLADYHAIVVHELAAVGIKVTD